MFTLEMLNFNFRDTIIGMLPQDKDNNTETAKLH
jgi:hypothetical protein